MKFGHDLLLLEAGAPANMRGQFIQYKQVHPTSDCLKALNIILCSWHEHERCAAAIMFTLWRHASDLVPVGRPARLLIDFYPQLKKLLNQLPAAEDRTEAEQDFFRQLRAEVRAVNQCALPACPVAIYTHRLA